MSHDYENQGELIIDEPIDHWGKLDRRIADDELISIEARGVLAWLSTRPRGHRLFVRYLQKRCGLSQARWQRLRKELEQQGYISVSKDRVNGKFTWKFRVNLIYRDPDVRTPTPYFPIGRFSTDGKITDGKPTDKERDKQLEINTTRSTHFPPSPSLDLLGVSISGFNGLDLGVASDLASAFDVVGGAARNQDQNQHTTPPSPLAGAGKEKKPRKKRVSMADWGA